MFREIFPQVSVKDLCHSIDNNVYLEAYNKSSIRQLGTCHLTARHGKQSHLCHFFVVPDYCCPILGLNDIHALNLISIHCYVTDKWSAGNLSLMSLYPNGDGESCISVFNAIEEKPGSMLTKVRSFFIYFLLFSLSSCVHSKFRFIMFKNYTPLYSVLYLI